MLRGYWHKLKLILQHVCSTSLLGLWKLHILVCRQTTTVKAQKTKTISVLKNSLALHLESISNHFMQALVKQHIVWWYKRFQHILTFWRRCRLFIATLWERKEVSWSDCKVIGFFFILIFGSHTISSYWPMVRLVWWIILSLSDSKNVWDSVSSCPMMG